MLASLDSIEVGCYDISSLIHGTSAKQAKSHAGLLCPAQLSITSCLRGIELGVLVTTTSEAIDSSELLKHVRA